MSRIKFCPGCLRKEEDILDNGCGSQRCPEMVETDESELTKLKLEKEKLLEIINNP